MKLKTHFLMLFVAFHMAAWAQDPPLPTGLGEESSPPSEEPQLPSGLDGNQAEKIKEKKYWKDQLPFTLNGFTETRGGLRLHNDPHQKDMSLAEARLHSEISKSWDRVSLNLASDFLYDAVIESDDFNLEDGQSWFDLREANLVLRPLSFLDLKLGRQILTWGTGDLLFINDLFPKDWNSFFIGRDLAYLKAPSDAIKASFFSPLANLDVVYTPQFDSDRYIDGQRISYFSQNQQSVVGRNDPVLVNQPNAWFEDDEWALRLYRQIKAHSVALYYYNGFWKSPSGFSLANQKYTFPKLSVYGASYRGPVFKGIFNAEAGYYQSHDDAQGNNPLLRNGEWRGLLGYEREVKANLKVSLQYYMEYMEDHANYVANNPAPNAQNAVRHMLTLRMTQLLMQQNLMISIFNFYGVNEQDGFLKASANYKLDDHWQAELGGNVFYGKDEFTFFGQFEDASNVYASIRYNF